MSVTRVVCWRHGRTAHNHTGTWQGQLDVPLDEVGHAQAAAAAAAILSGPHVEGSVTVVSSDLSRARDTAQVLGDLAGVPVRTDPRLREIDAGRWQGLTRDEIAAAGMAEELDAWRRGEDIRIGGGERRSEAGSRCAAAIAEHAAAGTGTLIVVGHGGVLRGTVLTMLGLPPDQWTLIGVLGNAHWAVLGSGPGRGGFAPGIPRDTGKGPQPGGGAGSEAGARGGAGVRGGAEGSPEAGSEPKPDLPGRWSLLAYNLSATPPANRFEVSPPARGRLAEPRH